MKTLNELRIQSTKSCPRCGHYLVAQEDDSCPYCRLKITWIEMYVALEDEE